MACFLLIITVIIFAESCSNNDTNSVKSAWNMVEQPLIFLKDENMHPLSIFLARIYGSELGIAFACGFLYMLPALLIFLYGENYFIEGIQLSGLK